MPPPQGGGGGPTGPGSGSFLRPPMIQSYSTSANLAHRAGPALYLNYSNGNNSPHGGPNGAGSGGLNPNDTRTQLFVSNLPFRVRWQDLVSFALLCTEITFDCDHAVGLSCPWSAGSTDKSASPINRKTSCANAAPFSAPTSP